MPIEVRDTDGGIGVIITYRGIVTDEEYLDTITAHLQQEKEKFQKYRYSFNDATAVTKVDITATAIDRIADLCEKAAKINPEPIVSLVADSDLAYGLSRMYETLVSNTPWEVVVFRSREEAMQWITGRARVKFGIDDLTFS